MNVRGEVMADQGVKIQDYEALAKYVFKNIYSTLLYKVSVIVYIFAKHNIRKIYLSIIFSRTKLKDVTQNFHETNNIQVK